MRVILIDPLRRPLDPIWCAISSAVPPSAKCRDASPVLNQVRERTRLDSARILGLGALAGIIGTSRTWHGSCLRRSFQALPSPTSHHSLSRPSEDLTADL